MSLHRDLYLLKDMYITYKHSFLIRFEGWFIFAPLIELYRKESKESKISESKNHGVHIVELNIQILINYMELKHWSHLIHHNLSSNYNSMYFVLFRCTLVLISISEPQGGLCTIEFEFFSRKTNLHNYFQNFLWKYFNKN